MWHPAPDVLGSDLTYFDPPPPPADLPARMPSPFEPVPHPLARRAAEELQERLRGGLPGVSLEGLDVPGRGKMFGVLVVEDGAGRVGYLRGFSGMLDGRWSIEGFAPPLFDAAAKDAIWPAGEAELRAYAALHRELVDRGADEERAALERERAARSNQLLVQILDTYVIVDARGERASLRGLHAPGAVPGGAGDCAAPKLLGQAYRLGLRPLAFAEFWWGAPPLTAERHAGIYYPACERKCSVVLPYMLGGLDVEDAPLVSEPELRVVHQDDALVVVDKPAGLLAVPGRHHPGRDSALVRLAMPGAQVVHELDAETSGLMLIARDPAGHAALARQLARGEATLRYVAWLDGFVAGEGEHGLVDLPLRLDFDDRPRRMYDPLHGKRALTEWRVLELGEGGASRVALLPRTDRTHQLRVHAAHPLGLNAPIVGDALYGRAGERLLLHADALDLVHPRTGVRVHFELSARF